MSIDLAFTNSGGREFQMLTILLEKKFNCQLLLQIGLISFYCVLWLQRFGGQIWKKSINIQITQTFETQYFKSDLIRLASNSSRFNIWSLSM